MIESTFRLLMGNKFFCIPDIKYLHHRADLCSSTSWLVTTLSPAMKEALRGLRQRPRMIPQHLLYDAMGVILFEEIKKNRPDYYPAWVEPLLIEKVSVEVAKRFTGAITLVDYGASSVDKALPLLIALNPVDYVAVDISRDALNTIEEKLAHALPHHTFHIHPQEQDFRLPFKIPNKAKGQLNVGLCAGNTLGNFEGNDFQNSLRAMRATLGDGSYLLIGMDVVNDKKILSKAYNDPGGVSASFALNVLARINREGPIKKENQPIFDIDKFKYVPKWEKAMRRMAMYLVSQVNQTVWFGGERLDFYKGEKIHIASSYKYPPEKFHKITSKTGWDVVDSWQDEPNFWSIYLLEAN